LFFRKPIAPKSLSDFLRSFDALRDNGSLPLYRNSVSTSERWVFFRPKFWFYPPHPSLPLFPLPATKNPTTPPTMPSSGFPPTFFLTPLEKDFPLGPLSPSEYLELIFSQTLRAVLETFDQSVKAESSSIWHLRPPLLPKPPSTPNRPVPRSTKTIGTPQVPVSGSFLHGSALLFFSTALPCTRSLPPVPVASFTRFLPPFAFPVSFFPSRRRACAHVINDLPCVLPTQGRLLYRFPSHLVPPLPYFVRVIHWR